MGLAFLMKTTYLLPLTVVILFVAVGSLAFRARRRRGYLPFAIGFVAAALLLAGKFFFESNPAMYVSAGLLFAASVWNAWPPRTAQSDPTASTEKLYQLGSNESESQP